MTSASTANSTAVLAELVGRKHDCLVRLDELGRRKQELIDVGAVGAGLFGILAETQQLIEQLRQLERGLDPYRGDDPSRRAWSSEAERVRVSALAERSARLLADVLERDARCEETLRRRSDETAAQLALVNSAVAARSAYVDDGGRYGSSLDVISDT
jgi:hypothetical protein